MTNAANVTVLIIEPNQKLAHPYNLLPSQYHITRVSTIVEAQQFVAKTLPSVVFLSASFSAQKSVSFLENVYKQMYLFLPKLVFVVDLDNTLSTIPGISWAGLANVISSQTPPKMIDVMLAQ